MAERIGCLNRPWLVGVSTVERSDQVGGVSDILFRFPAGGIGCVVKARPLYEVQKTGSLVATVDFAIQDSVDFVFRGVVNLEGRWRVIRLVRNQTGISGLEERNMEDQVYAF